ncbi:MAG: DUF2490 domain-containing protein [Alistipes sp.]|nr:DUF2490 domain-containing protein [Alistipes sp.]
MKNTIKTICLMILLAVPFAVQAQEEIIPPTEITNNDIQGRFRAGLEIPLDRAGKLDFSWNEQVRLHNNFKELDKVVSSVGLSYKPINFLSVGADYSLVNQRDEDDGKWAIRHRVNFDVTGMYRAGRVKLSLRERVRVQFRGDSICKYEHANPFFSLRSRFKVAYDIFQSRWEPYAFAELYTTLNAPAAVANYKNEPLDVDNYISRVRFAVGAEYKINMTNRIDIYYMLHLNKAYDARYKANVGDIKELRLTKGCAHVFCIDYKFKL